MPLGPSQLVAIVSQNVETAKHLRDYFESRSLLVHVHTRLLEAMEEGEAPSSFILFPDEFPKGDVELGLLALMRELIEARVVVVTSDTQRFLSLRAQLVDAAQTRLIVLPRPAWSWTLLEHVIRPSTVSDSARGF